MDSDSLAQDAEDTTTACLVTATKDRARGPQGRRLPQRKSMMPSSVSGMEVNDIRQRSISLSTPQANDIQEEEEDGENSSPRLQTSRDSKWLSLSMEEMERDSDDAFETQRSSSAFDIPQQKESPASRKDSETSAGKPVHKRMAPRLGNLLGQHAALTKELEMKLKAGRTPGARRLASESEEEDQTKNEENGGKNIEHLTSKVNSAKDTLNALEEKVSLLTKKVDATNENNEKTTSQVGDILLQVTVTLQEAERINSECKRALEEVNKARMEYQTLAKECKETLARMNIDSAAEDQAS